MPRELIERIRLASGMSGGGRGDFNSRQVDVGRSLSTDRRSKTKTITTKCEGDRGDRRA